MYEVEYCAYSLLQRTISSKKGESLTAGEFEVRLNQGHTGIFLVPNTPANDEIMKGPEPPTA